MFTLEIPTVLTGRAVLRWVHWSRSTRPAGGAELTCPNA